MSQGWRGKSKFKRIILKLSGEFLQNRKAGLSVDPTAALSVAARVKTALDMGVQTGIVIGGGNIVRGAVAEAAGADRVISDQMGMLATVINAMALRNALEKLGVESVVQSAIRVGDMVEPIVVERAVACLRKGKAVLFAGGTGNPFFTTDTTAALRASEVGADAVLKATKVDGIYSSDPVKNPKAQKLAAVSFADALGMGLRIMDATAFALCMENRIPIVVFDFYGKDSIKNVLAGKRVGTLVS
jgi:uridylate kinase